MEDGSGRGGCRVGQLLARVEAKPDRNSAKSAGSGEFLSGSGATGWLRCRSREAGSSPKLCQTFYRRRTEVWGMDLPEVGAEFGSCCHSARVILIGILQNRQEMQFSRKDRLAQGSYDAEVGRWGQGRDQPCLSVGPYRTASAALRPTYSEQHQFRSNSMPELPLP